MRKFFRNLGIISLICFSFYFTEKTVVVIKNADELMIELKSKQHEYFVEPIDGIIQNNTFIPGISGKKVNINESYKRIKQYGMFNDKLLIYDEVKPKNKLEDNMDKYIISGNKNKKQVSIILLLTNSNYLDELLKILKKNNIKVNFFIDGNWLEGNREYLLKIVNDGHDIGNLSYDLDYNNSSYHWMDNIIKKATGEVNNYCYNIKENETALGICSLNQNYMIRPNLILDNNYLLNIKQNLKAGSIISLPLDSEIKDSISPITNYIKSKGYEVVTLDTLLKEN